LGKVFFKLHLKLVLSMVILWISLPVYASYYWDYPRYITKNTDKSLKSDVKVVDTDGEILVFYLEERKKSAGINYSSTKDFRKFNDPVAAESGIALKEGFSPHFDVIFIKNILFLAWNSMDGSLHYSTSNDKGANWQKEKVLIKDENFCFRPIFFFENNVIYLFYHTESVGRQIDFFYLESKDLGKTWTKPFQIAKGFAGSFFPFMRSYRGNLYVVWQSRPFSETQTPLFNVYLSISRDRGASWSSPLMLTKSLVRENTRPSIYFEGDRFYLLFEGDMGGASGIYYREYDLAGNPLSDEQKVNESLLNAKDPVWIVFDNELVVFYLDGRDGNERIYYSLKKDKEFIEEGPLGMKGKDIYRYSTFVKEGTIYLFWQDEGGIVFLGPDITVLPVNIQPLENHYIGISGVKVSWVEPKDSSGLEGYCYSFNKEKIDEPEIMNLSTFARSIHLKSAEEGRYYFHLRAMDKAGNYSNVTTIPFTVDITPPPAPVVIPLEIDENGFYRDNSPVFQWSIKASDVAGYNYNLVKRKAAIKNARIRTTKRRTKYRSIDEGAWVFNVAAVDRAGNVGKTSHYTIRLKPLPKAPVKIAPPWILTRETFEVSPVLNISLYLVLGGLLFIAFFISFDIFFKSMSGEERVQMETKASSTGVRKKRFGLRFKFSFLIVALILILTIGISTILSIVSTENQKRALADQMMDKAKLSLENMINVAREGILNNDELLLLSVIAKMMGNQDIMYSIILDTNNKVVAHSDINERGKVLTDNVTQIASKSNDIIIDPEYIPEALEKVYVLASPITFGDTRLGTVQIGYSTHSIFQTIVEARRENFYNAMIVTGVTILVGILGAVVMASIIIRPIKVLAKGANIIGEGRLDYKIHIKARDEIGLLSDEFNRMTERLLEYQKRMEEKAKFDEQLEIARKIQHDLIPQVGIDNEVISIDGFYKAAAAVGGDYYDFIQIGGERYGLIMSDVAGKGVPASLMMIMIRTVFKSLIHFGVSEPARVVTLMNDTLASDISSDRFATLLFGVFNRKNRYFRYTNAGYGPLMVYKREKNRCFLVNPPKDSMAIGVIPDQQYSEANPILLEEGDSLFLFTDGIHEARNEKEEEYGMNRLSNIIPSFADKGTKEMTNLILEDVLKFAGNKEQYDDMTLTVMKVK